ncbi:MAG: response regulator transcription factor [Chloroflexota bacterium]
MVRGLTILFVDDEDLVRSGVVRGLQRLGHRVIEAARPQEALDLAEETLAGVDALVTDVLMPGVDGGTLAARLRERRPDLPVLFVSGYTPDESLRPHLDQPRTAFLAKPFDREDLVAAIGDLLAADATA